MAPQERLTHFHVPDHLRKPPDVILGLQARYELNPDPGKINAGVGVFRGENGEIFAPSAIAEAQRQIHPGGVDYIGPTGPDEYLGNRKFLTGTARLALGGLADELLEDRKLVLVGTVGGTNAVALAADTIRAIREGVFPLVLGTPTWPNHSQIAAARGLPVITYEHLINDSEYNMPAHLVEIRNAPDNAVVLFHTGKTHNPTGINPQTEDEWRQLARATDGKIALFDTPYAGFGDGLIEDTRPIRIFMEEGITVVVAMSYSKNGGIYGERAGALIIPTGNRTEALQLQRVCNFLARVSYSSPPAHGEAVIANVFSDPELLGRWTRELARAAALLKERRACFAKNAPEFDYVSKQTGLFSLLPLTDLQIEELENEFAIYMPRGGRVNFGGIPTVNIPRFAQAINEVLQM